MRKKAEYKSALRSKRMIRQAYVELMQEKPLEKITVTDVVKKADLNRGTFYAHYRNTKDILNQIENEIINEILESFGESHYRDFFQNPLQLFLKLAEFINKDREFFRLLIKSSGSEQFLIKLKRILVEHIIADAYIPESIKKTNGFVIQVNFVAGGIVSLCQLWFNNEINCSLEELSKIASKIVIDSWKGLL